MIFVMLTGFSACQRSDSTRFFHEDFPRDSESAAKMRSFHLKYVLKDVLIESGSVNGAVKQLNEAAARSPQNGATAGSFVVGGDIHKPITIKARRANVLWVVDQICGQAGCRFVVDKYAIAINCERLNKDR